jgi:hypothetical protein
MAYELKEGQGSLFKNDRKEADTHADYNGSIKIDGREYWLNAWIKNANDPDKKTFMSLSAKPKEARNQGAGGFTPGGTDDPDSPF